MIHMGANASGVVSGGGGGGGGGGSSATVAFSPAGGDYSGTSKSVSVTVTGAPKLRWKIDSGAYTTVNGTAANVTVPLSVGGHVLTANAIDASSNVLATHSDSYFQLHSG